MAKNTYNLRRSSKNPVGSNSYIDRTFDSGKLDAIRKTADFPKSHGWKLKQGMQPYDKEGRRNKSAYEPDYSTQGTAQLPAAISYGNRIFRVRMTDPVRFPEVTGRPPTRLKGGLASYLDGWTEEDEDLERLQDAFFNQFRLTPRIKAPVGKGETTVDYWSGGFDALKQLGSDWLTDVTGRTYSFGNLAPWQPDNPQGTGIWRDIAAQIINRTVRGDEAYAAGYVLREDLSPALRAYTRGKMSAAELKDIYAKGISDILLVIYGSDLKEDVDLANQRGIESLKGDAAAVAGRAAAREEKRAAQPVSAGGATSAHRAAQAARSLQERRARELEERQRQQAGQAAPPPPPAAAPQPSEAKVEAAAAAVTAPVTPAAPAAAVISDALQALLDLGLSMSEAQKVMAKPPAERVKFMLVLMGN